MKTTKTIELQQITGQFLLSLFNLPKKKEKKKKNCTDLILIKDWICHELMSDRVPDSKLWVVLLNYCVKTITQMWTYNLVLTLRFWNS
jgi:hypothetical protein